MARRLLIRVQPDSFTFRTQRIYSRMHTKPMTQNVHELQQKVEHAEHVKRITTQIHAASNLDQILLDLHKDILSLFDAEDLTLFA